MKIYNSMQTDMQIKPSFGKILKFDNEYAQIFEQRSVRSRSIELRKSYAEFLDTFSKSEPLKQFISQNDVNVTFKREGIINTGLTKFCVTIKDPSSIIEPTILEIESKGISFGDDIFAFKDLTNKIANIKYSNLEDGLENAKLQTKIALEKFLASKSYNRKDEAIKINILDQQIQKTIDIIKNM